MTKYVLQKTEKRRANNLIWNAAKDYSLRPDLQVYDENGHASLYWNTVIGAVHRHYDYAEINKLRQSFKGTTYEFLYENLLWLALEHCTYAREVEDRTILANLRQNCARHIVDRNQKQHRDCMFDRIETAHFQHVLGETVQLPAAYESLVNQLEPVPTLSTMELMVQLRRVFEDILPMAKLDEDTVEVPKKTFRTFFSRKKPSQARLELFAVRDFGIGISNRSSHDDSLDGTDKSEKHFKFHLPTVQSQSVDGMREYMETYFGQSMYTKQETTQLERSLCQKTHEGCHLHFTRGGAVLKGKAGGFAAYQRKSAVKQIAKNKEAFLNDYAKNHMAILRLTHLIRNSMLVNLQSAYTKTSAGRLNAGKVWRSLYLNDSKVFQRYQQDNIGNLTVDILLDGSTSQLDRQERVSVQAYIIAESLSRCHIPVRVYSYCSMSGFTVINLFRDYGEPERNDNIFNYFTTGCNRDGLAIRTAHHLLKHSQNDNRLLIILSDAKPNDVKKVKTPGDPPLYRNYADDIGIRDAAAEVRAAKRDGISVISVFTGKDENVPAAKRIYGRNFARIKSVDQFADTVGLLIQNQMLD